jgi:anthranilate synthase/indole-3-glycerol phosphate synthase/phosphoribosylanthranilate isomerase
VLVGEALMRAADPAAAIADLLQGASAPVGKGSAPLLAPALVKVCGVTDPADALDACRAGASLIGVIFAPGSKRRATDAQAQAVVAAVRSFGERDAPVRVTLPAGARDAAGASGGDGVDPGARLRAGGAALRAASVRTPLVVGVFQDQPAADVLRLALASGVDLVQYHGSEDDALVNAVGLPALRVLHLPPLEVAHDGSGGSSASSASSVAAARARALAGPGGALRLAVGGSAWVVAALLDTAVPGARGGTGRRFDWSTAAALGDRCPVLVAGGLDGATVGGALAACGGGALGVDASSGLEAAPGVKDRGRVEAFVHAAKAARPQA